MAGMDMISADWLDDYVNCTDCLLIDLRDRED